MFKRIDPRARTEPGNTVQAGVASPPVRRAAGTLRNPATPARRFSLTRWFSLLSIVCIGATSVLTSVVLSRFLTDRGLEEFFTHVAKLPDVLRTNFYARDQAARLLGISSDTLRYRIDKFGLRLP
jgi:hypothetical protein